MKAAIVHGKEDIRYEEVPIPSLSSKDVLVKIEYCGICGSDIPRVNQGMCHFFPITLGHEFSGVVESVGEEVVNLQIGDHIACAPLLPCMTCSDCQRGNYHLCPHYSFVGTRQAGGMAEYVALPEMAAVKIDKEIPFIKGAFFEPSTVALHGLRDADYVGGKTVAVLGTGNIGLFMIQWAKIFGAKKVVAFDISDEKLDLGREVGADVGINTLGEKFVQEAKVANDGQLFDYVFETAGSIATMKMCYELARNNATVVMVGKPTEKLTFSVNEWEQLNRKSITLRGSWLSYSAPFPGEEWELTAHYFKTGQLKFDHRFVDQIVPLSQVADAFVMFKNGDAKGKVVLKCQE